MLLDVRLEKLIIDRFKRLNVLQQKSTKAVLTGDDVIVVAPTGFGKTEAVMMPIFHKLLEYKENEDKGIQVVYVTPLRSLNRDMMSRLKWWANKLGITIGVRHGDTPQSERNKQSRRPPQLLITTPETLTSLISAKRLGIALSYCKHVVVDEIHSIMDNKRGMQLTLSLERLDERAKENHGSLVQRIGVSATIGNKQVAMDYLSPSHRDCRLVDIDLSKKMDIKVEKPAPYKKETDLDMDEESLGRLMRVKDLVEKDKTLIFVNTRQVAEALGSRLLMLDVDINVHHGSLAKSVRVKTEDDFKSNRLTSLLATSSLELGIDIGDVNHVVQYMSPRQVSRLVQRIGRSGHTMDRVPAGTLIVSDTDDIFESLAITNLLHKGWQEELRVEKNAYDVIGHQLIGLLLDRDRVKLDDVDKIFSRASTYSIEKGELIEIAEQMSKQRKLYYDQENNELRKSLGSRVYYYTHLSTIPNTKRFRVKDIERNRFVSTLDGGFVATLAIGDSFITKGLPWRVIDIAEGKVLVEASQDFSLSLPDWEGEEIPVPFEIAQEASKYRRLFVEGKKLPVNFKGSIDIPNDKFIPDDKTLIIESYADLLILHAPFGTLINATLGRLLAQNLSIDINAGAKLLNDPYRIIIQTNSHIEPTKVKNIIKKLAKSDYDSLKAELVSGFEGTRLLAFKFNHASQHFGMMKAGERVSKRLMQFMKHLPVYKETIRMMLKDYFNVKGTKHVLDLINTKEVNIKTKNTKKISGWARYGLTRVHGSELISEVEPHSEIVQAFAENLLEKHIKLKCTYCDELFYVKIKEVKDKIKCPKCKSPMIGYAGHFNQGKFFDKKDNFIQKSAPLIQAYGKRALIALSVYGVGISKAKRVLKKLHRSDEAFYLDLMEEQKKFIKTKRFWKL